MSYQVIARKYRPQRFSDVVGQEHVTETLAHAIEQNRIAHAYLFVGPRGTGKTTIARIFAKCLNATGGPKVDFADGDPPAVEITEGRSLDVLEIDGASNRGIEEIRALRETVKYAPATSRFKIYIIDEVHMLTKEAFNALLKTLEEPPEHVKFMFATTEPEKVLPTILSRCQRFDLRRIPIPLIVGHLGQIAKLEGVEAEEAALQAVARGSEGCMRDAESALDQLISFCGNRIVESDVLSMFGLSARGQIFSLVGSIVEGETDRALRELNALAQQGKDLARLLSDVLAHFRNLLLYQVTGGDRSVLEVSDTELQVLNEQAPRLKSEAVTRIMEVLVDSESRLRDTASKKVFLEVALLKAIQARQAVSLETVLQRLKELRAESGPAHQTAAAVASGPAPVSAVGSAVPAAPVLAARSVAAGEPLVKVEENGGRAVEAGDSSSLGALWASVVDAVGRTSPFTRSYLMEAHPVGFDQKVFTIGFDPEFADHLALVDNPKNRALIQTKLKELGCGEVQIKFVRSEAPGPRVKEPMAEAAAGPGPIAKPASGVEPAKGAAAAAPPEPKPERTVLTKEDFKNDPLIKQALEIFKGQIIEVRS